MMAAVGDICICICICICIFTILQLLCRGKCMMAAVGDKLSGVEALIHSLTPADSVNRLNIFCFYFLVLFDAFGAFCTL